MIDEVSDGKIDRWALEWWRSMTPQERADVVEVLWQSRGRPSPVPDRHYLIIGGYTGQPIGCTWGESGKLDVLEEEARATFREIPKEQCPICGEGAK